MSKTKNTPEATTNKDEQVVIRRKPNGQTIRRIGTATNKVDKAFADDKAMAHIKTEALAGIAVIRNLTGTKLLNNGKLSPFGHMAEMQNGLIDREIIKCVETIDFAAMIKSVAKANPKSRKSDVDDNTAMLKRLDEHIAFMAGQTATGRRKFPTVLAKLGLEKHIETIMNSFVPFRTYFHEYVKAIEA